MGGRNTDVRISDQRSPYQGWNPHLGLGPDLELNPRPLGAWDPMGRESRRAHGASSMQTRPHVSPRSAQGEACLRVWMLSTGTQVWSPREHPHLLLGGVGGVEAAEHKPRLGTLGSEF